MNARLTYVITVTGVMSIKPITKFVFVIVAMAFIVVIAMKWTNATIVTRFFVPPVPLCCLANFAAEASVKIVPRRVDGTWTCLFFFSIYLRPSLGAVLISQRSHVSLLFV